MSIGDTTRIFVGGPPLPPALPHFAHIRRTWDGDLGLPVAKLLPGDYYVTRHNEAIFHRAGLVRLGLRARASGWESAA